MSVGHYENFPVASVLVPKRLRPAVVAIYRFARSADDLADEGDAPPEERLAALAAYDDALAAIGRGEIPPAEPFPALAAAIRAHALPLSSLSDLVSAFRQDVVVARYPRYEDLLDYCRRSANPVGRLMLRLYDAETPANLAASDAVCTGLQLANFWQDVAGDWARGRVYLPQEDLARFGVVDAQIGQGLCDANWRTLIAFETARTRTLLDAGRPLAARLPLRLGLEIAGVIAGGLRILSRIDAVDGDVFRRRPVLHGFDWCAVAYHALRMRRSGRSALRAEPPIDA